MGKANFGIALDGDNYVEAGTHLRGTVFADVTTEITGSSITLTFSGQETTRVAYERRDGDDEVRTQHANGRRSLIKVTIPVSIAAMMQGNSNNNNRIRPGKYQLPFDLQLPASLPATASYTTHNGSGFKIKYTLKAILKGSGKMWNYNCDREVVIRAKALDNSEPIPFNAKPVTEHIKLCCCLNRGALSFGAKVADTRLNRGSTTFISLSCRNHSTVRVLDIHAQLEQQVHFSAAGGYRTSDSKTLINQKFGHIDGMERLGKQGGESHRQQQVYEEIFREVQENAHRVELLMPLNALNTYKGSLIQISHILIITVETRCCITNPTIRIPLQVGEPQRTSSSNQPPLLTASAVIPDSFSDQSSVASTVYVPSTAATVGGVPTDEDPDNVVSPSLATLLKEMEATVADLDLIQAKAHDSSSWKSVWQGLSPADYGAILVQVDSDFDQPRVAVAVAQLLVAANGRRFTCPYVVAALQAVSDWNRGAVCEKLLPYCSDLAANHETIRVELTDWEQMTTARAFEEALQK